MSADVFVSDASKDRDRVLPLVQRLQALGVSVWIDRAGIDLLRAKQQDSKAQKQTKQQRRSIRPGR